MPSDDFIMVHMPSHGFTCLHIGSMASHGFTPPYMWFTWAQIISHISYRFACDQIISHVFTWVHMASHGFTYVHIGSHGLTWAHIGSDRFTRFHMV